MHDHPRHASPRSLILATLALAAAAPATGCGARTGLLLGEIAPRDAGPDAPFAGAFPCAWSMGRALRIATSAQRFHDLEGTVHETDDRALVGAHTGTAGPWHGAVVSLPAGGSLDHRVTTRALGTVWGSTTDWWEVQAQPVCTLRRRDDALGVLQTGMLFGGPCRVGGRRDPAFLEVVGLGDGGFVLTRTPVETGHATLVTPISGFTLTEPHVTFAEGLGWIVLDLTGGRIHALRIADPPAASPLWDADVADATTLSTDADRLHAGIVVLRKDASGAFHLERLGFEMTTPRPAPLIDMATLPSAPLGTVTTTESAAGLPLTDGHLAFVPLGGGRPTLVGPLPEPGLEDAVLVMRTGTSIGGVLYQDRERSSHILRFRALTCQR